MKRSLFIWTMFGFLFAPFLGRGAVGSNKGFLLPENPLVEKPKTKEKQKKQKKKKKKSKKKKEKKQQKQHAS